VSAFFDPELYLRLYAEQAILERSPHERSSWESPLDEAADALSAIGALDDETLDAIVDDYQLALSLRGRESGPPRASRRRSSGPGATVVTTPLIPDRIVTCDQELEQSWGRLHLHYVALGEQSTSLAITAKPMTDSSLGRHGLPVALQQVALTDDRGTTTSAHFSGGGGSGGWRGHLTTNPPLSRTTRWITLGSTRIELCEQEDREPPPVSIESVPGRLAERYLSLRLATAGHLPMIMAPDGVEVSIQTLIAAGALDDHDPIISVAKAVAHSSPVHGLSAQSTLPEPWASLTGGLRSGGGPKGVIPIGVVTPPIDGVTIRFDVLVSTDHDFSVQAATSPRPNSGFMGSGNEARIAWWAEDDQGNHYLGGIGSWSGGLDFGQGMIAFGVPLDPTAGELRLTPTGLSERAVVSLRLLPWAVER
jgi:hypothetical protein